MRRLFAIFILLGLFFGCVGQQAPAANVTAGNISGTGTGTSGPSMPSLGCTDSYTVSGPKDATLSETGTMSVKAVCAKGKLVRVLVDGKSVGSTTVPADPAQINFELAATKEGTSKIVVTSDNKTVHSTSWDIKPIGFTNTSGSDNEQISISHWRAIAFNVSNQIEVRNVRAYLRRLQSYTIESNLVLELRADSGNEPGSLISSTTISTSKVTLTPNWIDLPINATLSKGRYWLVFSIDTEHDSVNIHYIPIDKKAKGNEDHLLMVLTKDRITQTWDESVWERLPYDKRYTFIVSSAEPQ